MKGWEIFVHSVRLVFTNLDAALKLSLVPYAISMVAFVYFGADAAAVVESGSMAAYLNTAPEIAFNYVAYGIISGVVTLWIAVAWHRYVLLEEYPSGWLPTFHGLNVLRYFVKGFLIGLCVVGVVIITLFVMSLLLGWTGNFGAFLIGFSLVGIGSYLFYRLCPALPAAAVGQSMSLSEAWEATKNQDQTIGILVLLVIFFSYFIQLPGKILEPSSVVATSLSLLIGWFSMMIGSSVLTTFYGHFVEGRDID